MTRNLVLGQATGYSFADVAPFVETLARSRFDGDCVLLVDHRQQELVREIARRGFRAEFRETLRFLDTKPQLARFLGFWEYLLNRPGAYENVLLCDTRDVVFQGDPFDPPPERSLCVFEESRSQTIGSCRQNAKWIARCFGRRALRDIEDRAILCCGTLLGTTEGVLGYLRALGEVAEGLLGTRAWRKFGTDQAILNHVVYTGRLPDVAIVPNGRRVSTMAHLGEGDWSIGDDGVVRNADGSVSSILHQYDRHPALVAHFGAPDPDASRERLRSAGAPSGRARRGLPQFGQ